MKPGRRDRPPVLVVAGAAMGVALLALPLLGLVVRAPWASLGEILGQRDVHAALRLSLLCSLWATLVAGAVGLPLAWTLARFEFRGRRIVRAVAIVPLVLPPVVGGVALLLVFGRRGLVGQWLHTWFGLSLPFTMAGAVLAEAFVALPFFVLTAESAFRNADRRLEDAARTLGADRWTVFRRVTLPLTAPALAAGAVLAWARALGEFGATITFAGNAPGRTTTVPLEVYLLLDSGGMDEAVVLSLVLLAVCLLVLVGLRDRWMTTL